jgi:hypothetical protein
VTIIESTAGNVFGGYTPLRWSSTGGWENDSSLKTFLFTLKNPHGIAARKFMIKNKGVNAIYGAADRLAFGPGHSLYVCDNCNTSTENHVSFGSSFENDTGINPQSLLNGTQMFTVQEIEIFAAVE